MTVPTALEHPVLLENPIQRYAWGSHTALASYRGQARTEHPEAELWIGAHASAPSLVNGRGLDAMIESDPATTLGTGCIDRFGEELPFLLKVLAVDAPLSLQAHPTRAQAEAGFRNEEAMGVPLSSPTRVFKDRNHKPELICALTQFEALCGFRPVAETAALLELLETPSTIGMAARLRKDHPAIALRAIVVDLLSLPSSDAASVLSEVLTACSGSGPFADERRLATRLAKVYPGDIGAVISLLLNRVVLRPGDALSLPAGNLHAYIRGVGVELMSNSDNVLRGGLTPKHVDVPGLLAVLDFSPLPDPVQQPVAVGPRWMYPSPSPEFTLERLDIAGETELVLAVSGPELLWCEHGNLIVGATHSLPIQRNDGVFIPAATAQYRLSGSGTVFRATVGS